MNRSSFTLIELLIVIAVIAVLATVVILVLNPAQMLMAARDGNRVSDMHTLNQALTLYSEDVGTGMGASSVVYVSIPDPSATSTLGDQCQGLGFSSSSLPAGWSWHCAGPQYYKDINGEGWIPVDFTKMSSGSPMGSLPVDPVKTTSTGLYYTYTVNGDPWELTANMESQKYQAGGSHDVVSTDGGQYPDLYEVGTDLSLDPIDYDPSLVGYWKLDEGSGTIAYDSSGHGNNGVLVTSSTDLGPTWITSGCLSGNCLSFDGTDDYVNAGNEPIFDSGTVSANVWVKTSASQSSGVIGGKAALPFSSPRGFYLDMESGKVCWHVADANYVWHSTCSTLTYDNNEWHDVVGVTGAAGTYLYVDATLVATDSATGYSHSNAENFLIGGGGSYSFSGFIDDLRIYNRALSASEIQAIYDAEK